MTEPPRDASSDDPAPVRRLAHPPEQKPIFSQDTRAWQIADQLATCLLYGKETSDLATWERHRLMCLCRASGLDDQDADHLRRIACRMTRDDREIGYLFSRASRAQTRSTRLGRGSWNWAGEPPTMPCTASGRRR